MSDGNASGPETAQHHNHWRRTMKMSDWLSGRVFQFVHQHNLVYNTCWEDPRLDRIALRLGPDDTVLVITSAGCNALDYALAGPKRIIAVDVNPRQNALLELKLAAVRHLRYEDFFAMFGTGRLDQVCRTYTHKLRPSLSPWAQTYWDRWIEFFEPGNMRSFYFRGTCGMFAMLMNLYVNRIAGLRPGLDALLSAKTVEEQSEIYVKHLHDRFWTQSVRFLINRDATLSLLGVPRAQRRQVETGYRGGVIEFVHDCIEAVFARLPLADNYFWRVYIHGQYSPDCCPEYLTHEGFERLKGGLAERIEVHTDSIQGFLEKNETAISRFVLLDHMDWLADHLLPSLQQEWQWIARRATRDARLIWRSGGMSTDFVDRLNISVDGRPRQVGEMLNYDPVLAAELHQQCRVHTYGSFHIAEMAA